LVGKDVLTNPALDQVDLTVSRHLCNTVGELTEVPAPLPVSSKLPRVVRVDLTGLEPRERSPVLIQFL
jgi:hypothetical protein